MAKPTRFTVLVRDLPTHRRFEVDSVLVADWLRGLPMRDALGAPEHDPDAGAGVAELDLYADGANVLAAGTFHGHLMVACSRCVEPVRLAIDDKIRVTFMPAAEMPAEDAEGEGVEVAEDDLDLFPYDGERVDLEPLFREEFVLAVPFAPLCSETCKGLCPQCGVDLDRGTCSCEAPGDPRLAALRSFLPGGKPSGGA